MRHSRLRVNPVIRRVFRGVDWAVKPSLPITDGNISPAIRELLSTPSWSVRSLLPAPQSDTSLLSSTIKPSDSESEINSTKLRHLLKLSALPPPSSPAEEASLLKSLTTHIHFVRAIQAVDTTGVNPLINIRDETPSGIASQTIELSDLEPYLAQEEKVGWNGTVRRRGKVDLEDEVSKRKELRDWWIDVWRLGAGGESRRKGNYLFVRREKTKKMKQDESQASRTVGEQNSVPAEDKDG